MAFVRKCEQCGSVDARQTWSSAAEAARGTPVDLALIPVARPAPATLPRRNPRRIESWRDIG